MATKAQIMGGLEILAKYARDDDHCFVRAEHDQIWCGDETVSAEDAAKLEALGWFVSEEAWSRFV